MTAAMKAIWNVIAQLAIVVVLLAAVTALAWTSHLSSVYAYAVVTTVLGATGVSAGIVLGNPGSNTPTAPHVVVAVLVLIMVTILAIHGMFSDTEVTGVLAIILGAGILSSGSASGSAPSINLTLPASPPPPPPA